jgi:hypothetical protein
MPALPALNVPPTLRLLQQQQDGAASAPRRAYGGPDGPPRRGR